MRVLLATDGSEFSDEAARFLTRFDFTPGDEIIILHVISEVPYEDDYSSQVMHAIKRVAPKILASASAILKPSKAAIATLEKEGYPDTAIIETAINTGSDLIVMGARGVRGIKTLVLGSSSRAVSVSSPKPVLVVKHPREQAPSSMRVLFATDGSEYAAEAGRFLASLPITDAEITIMHAYPSALSDIPAKFAAEIISAVKPGNEKNAAKRGEKVVEEAKSHLGARFGKLDTLVAVGDPFREVLAAEKSLKPDIILVGCRGLRGVRSMMGSVSRRLLGHSESSVLIGRACGKED